MKKLWVVECQYNSGEWGVCDFAELSYVDTNYFMAHKKKRAIQKYLKTCAKFWTKSRVRITKYIPN